MDKSFPMTEQLITEKGNPPHSNTHTHTHVHTRYYANMESKMILIGALPGCLSLKLAYLSV